MRMVVTAKSAKVYNRTLTAGDTFDVPEKEGRMYAALGRAKQVSDGQASAVNPDDIDALRASYKARTGRDPDMRWGVARLRNELAQGGTYGRRDMRAGD